MSEQILQIIPMISYENGIAAMEWLRKVFGFSEKTRMLNDNRILTHGEISLGEGIIMLTSPTLIIKARNITAGYMKPLQSGMMCLILSMACLYMLMMLKIIINMQKWMEQQYFLV